MVLNITVQVPNSCQKSFWLWLETLRLHIVGVGAFQLVAQSMQYRKDTPILMQVSFQNMEILCQDPPLAVQAVC